MDLRNNGVYTSRVDNVTFTCVKFLVLPLNISNVEEIISRLKCYLIVKKIS